MHTIKNFQLKTSLSDMTVGEFEKVSEIMNDPDLMQIEKYIDVLSALGMPESIINELTDEELFETVKKFGEYEYDDTLPRQCTASDGYTYVAYDDTFVLKAMDMAKIEKAFKTNKDVFSTILAVIFKREDLTSKEHYTDAHIKHKKSIVKEWNAGEFYPYVVNIMTKLNNRLQKKIENSENAE